MTEPVNTTPHYKNHEADEYAEKYSADLVYEKYLIEARHRVCLDFLKDKRSKSVVEIGCGPSLLLEHMDSSFDFIQQWSIVEASMKYLQPAIDKFGPQTQFGAQFSAFHGYFEEVIESDAWNLDDKYDAVVLSGLIHETSEPELLLKAAKCVLKPGGWCYVLVPNGLSFHRLLAVKMKLVDDPSARSQRNELLGQDVVYTPGSLRALMDGVGGFENFEYVGHTLKLFTNTQSELIVDAFGADIAKGLEELGKDFHLNAAEFAWIAQYQQKA